jgi:hypothetical protein
MRTSVNSAGDRRRSGLRNRHGTSIADLDRGASNRGAQNRCSAKSSGNDLVGDVTFQRHINLVDEQTVRCLPLIESGSPGVPVCDGQDVRFPWTTARPRPVSQASWLG